MGSKSMGSRSTSRSICSDDLRYRSGKHDGHVRVYQNYLEAIEKNRLQEIAWRRERRWTWRNYLAWFFNKIAGIL